MTGKYSTRTYMYFCISAICFLLTVATGKTESLIVAAPFAVALLIATFRRDTPRVKVSVSLSRHTMFEGQDVTIKLAVQSETKAAMVEVIGLLPRDSVVTDGVSDIFVSLPAGERKAFVYSLTVPSRGRFAVGNHVLRTHGDDALAFWEEVVNPGLELTVYPSPHFARKGLSAVHTQIYAGSYTSHLIGEGLEFADIRELSGSDRLTRINWRATARSDRFFGNEFSKERNADVVVLIDTFFDVGSAGDSFLDWAARGAATISHHYIERKNRVGLVELGYYLRYLNPRPGKRHWYRILDNLAQITHESREVGFTVSSIPRRILPPKAMIFAFSTLEDERFLSACIELKFRGYDILVVAVSPVQLIGHDTPVRGRKSAIQTESRRILRLETSIKIDRIRSHGVPLILWDIDEPFSITAPMGGMRSMRGRGVS